MKININGKPFRVTCEFNEKDSLHPNGHTGIDFSMPSGTELESVVDGTVIGVPNYGDSNIGKGVIIRADDGSNVIYGHLSEQKVEIGSHINKGDIIGLSGDTGRSTAPHLHLGLKDANGNFLNPEPLLNGSDAVESGKGIFNGAKSFSDFISRWYDTGSFWEAIYGKSFFEVLTEFLKELFHDISIFILGNGDIFFLMPAILIMLITFMVGANKYSKFTIPLWFLYFLSRVFYKMLL